MCLFLLRTNAISNQHICGCGMSEVVEFGPGCSCPVVCNHVIKGSQLVLSGISFSFLLTSPNSLHEKVFPAFWLTPWGNQPFLSCWNVWDNNHLFKSPRYAVNAIIISFQSSLRCYSPWPTYLQFKTSFLLQDEYIDFLSAFWAVIFWFYLFILLSFNSNSIEGKEFFISIFFSGICVWFNDLFPQSKRVVSTTLILNKYLLSGVVSRMSRFLYSLKLVCSLSLSRLQGGNEELKRKGRPVFYPHLLSSFAYQFLPVASKIWGTAGWEAVKTELLMLISFHKKQF